MVSVTVMIRISPKEERGDWAVPRRADVSILQAAGNSGTVLLQCPSDLH